MRTAEKIVYATCGIVVLAMLLSVSSVESQTVSLRDSLDREAQRVEDENSVIWDRILDMQFAEVRRLDSRAADKLKAMRDEVDQLMIQTRALLRSIDRLSSKNDYLSKKRRVELIEEKTKTVNRTNELFDLHQETMDYILLKADPRVLSKIDSLDRLHSAKSDTAWALRNTTRK